MTMLPGRTMRRSWSRSPEKTASTTVTNIAGRRFFGGRFGVLDLEFCCEDEGDAQQLYGKLREALPKRFKVKPPTSVSYRD